MTREERPNAEVPEEARAQRTWERYGAWLWLIGVLQFVVAMIVVQLAYGCANFGGCYNALTSPISNLGSGGFAGNPAYYIYQGTQLAWPYSQLWPVFNYSIFVLGAFLFAGIFLLQSTFPKTGVSTASLVILAVAGLGAAGVGVIPEDTLFAGHISFAIVAFGGAGLAVLVMGVTLTRGRWGRSWAAFSLIAGVFSMAAFVTFMLPSAGLLPAWPVYGSGFGYGAMERLVIAGPVIWFLLVATRILRAPASPTTAIEPSPAESPSASTFSSDRSPRRRRWENYGARIWLLGLGQFVAVMIASQFAYSCSNYGGCYNFLSNPISDLGSAGFATGNPPQITYLNHVLPWPTAVLWPVFDYSIMLFGICLLTGAFLVRSAFPRTSWSSVGLILLAIAGMGAAGVGIVPEDTLLAAHSSFAFIAFGLAVVGVLAMGVALAVGRSWGRRWTVYTLASGLFALPVMVIFSIPSLVGISAWAPYGNSFGYGAMERLIIVAPLMWIAAATIHLLRRPAGTANAARSGFHHDPPSG
ncbi:MAG: DUF998 domain-containing protein [Thermoplasmata archaeon]